jgi:hypothetical protein
MVQAMFSLGAVAAVVSAFQTRKSADSGRLMALFSGGFGRRLALSSRL